MDDMNEFRSSAQGSQYFEHVRVVDDMNDSRSTELWALNAMSSSKVWRI